MDIDYDRIVCFGDSITEAGNFSEADRWTSIMQRFFDSASPGEWKIFNRGVAGNTTVHGLDRIERCLIDLLPAIVTIEFGLNDCNIRPYMKVPRVSQQEYERNLIEIQRIITEHQGKAVFVVNHTVSENAIKPVLKNLKDYNKIVRRVAKTTKSPLIDLPKAMRKRQLHLDNFLQEDGVHLTEEGNLHYAQMIVDGLEDHL